MTSGDTALPPSDDSLKPSFAEIAGQVDALNRERRFPEALALGARLFEQHRDEPRAAAGLADTLIALGRQAEAEAVLRDSKARFPAERWISTRLAQLAAGQRNWAESAAQWREAGQPDAAEPDNLRTYAVVLANSGQAAAALQLVSAANRLTPRHRQLLMCEAELLLRLGKVAESAALFPALSAMFTWREPSFAIWASQIVLRLAPEAAVPILAAMLDEPDPRSNAWLPAIGRSLLRLAPADPAHEMVRSALKSRPDASGLTRSVAAGLTDASLDTDVIAARLAQAVADGRPGLLPLLLETAGSVQRQSRLRIALRLYLNRAFADPQAFADLTAASVCALLSVARVADADCLNYFAELARGRFVDPSQSGVALPDLSHPEAVAGHVAHFSDRAPAQPRPIQQRLRVALCVSGRLTVMQPATGLLRAIDLQAHDTTVFAHVWRATGGNLTPPGLDEVLQRLPPNLRKAFANAAEAGGLVGLRRLFPSLLQGRLLRDSVDITQVRQILQTEHVTVEDEAALAGRSVEWKACHSARQAHLQAANDPAGFDLYIHVTADAGLIATSELDWIALARAAQDRALISVETGYQFNRATGFSLAGRFAAGSRSTMDLAAASFLLGERVASGAQSVFGMTQATAMAQCLAMTLHLHGVEAEPVRGLRFGAPPDLAPVGASAALALLWQDIRSRRSAAPDTAMVNAAMADVTGGIGI